EKAAGPEAILTDVNLDFAMIESQMAIIRSSVFLRRVVEKENLAADIGARRAGGHSMLGWLFSSQPEPAAEGPRAEPTPEEREGAIQGATEALKGAVSVARAGQGYVLAISVTNPDPHKAARLANAVADAFLVDKLDTRFEAAKRASTWLSDRLAQLRTQLRESEEAAAKVRAEHGLYQGGSSGTLSPQQPSGANDKPG